jgi:putative inorganic carbon (HCO3(-)) transporter
VIARRLLPPVFALTFLIVPLFPAFITLTAVAIPGVSLVPRSFAITLLVAMAAVASYFAFMLLQRPIQRPPTMLPLLTWLGAALIAALLGFDPGAGLLFIGIFGLCTTWHLVIVRYYSEPGASAAIFWSYLLSGTLAALAAIVMVIARAPADLYTIGHGRAIGTFVLPGELAGYLIIFLPIAFALARVTRRKALRALAVCALLLGTAALALTFSRAGWMGFAAAVAFFAFTGGGVRRRYAPLILLGGLAAVLIVFNAHHNPAENYTRLSIWQAGIEIVRRFPLTGVGPFDFARVYPFVRQPDGDLTAFHAHSFLLTIFAETGIVGVVAVLFTWWRFGVALRDRLRTARPAEALVALAIAAGLVGTWVQGLIDTVSVVIFGMWLPAMALALAVAQHGLGDVVE